VLSPLSDLEITGSHFKWDCGDGFPRQSYPVLAAWVGAYPEQVWVTQISYISYPMCVIPKGTPKGHLTFRTVDHSIHQYYNLALLEETYVDVSSAQGVHPIHNQFWHYPLCNVYQLWQSDELHQLLLGLVKALLYWLFKYLIARNVKDQFDNEFTLVPRYLGL